MDRLGLTLAVLLSACSAAPDIQAPRPQRLPSGLQVEGVGRLAIDEPLTAPYVTVAPDSEPPGRLLPRDRWFRIALPKGSQYDRLWAWVRAGGVGCIIAFYRPGIQYQQLVGEYHQRLGPSVREDTQSNPVARWTLWADDRMVWSIVGPKPDAVSIVALMISARDPAQDPNDPTSSRPCSVATPSPGAG